MAQNIHCAAYSGKAICWKAGGCGHSARDYRVCTQPGKAFRLWRV